MNDKNQDEKVPANDIDGSSKPAADALEINGDVVADDLSLEQDSEFAEHSARQSKDVVADLRKRLKKCEEEKNAYLLGWQKTKADYINARKQDEESSKQAIKYAEADLVSELLSVLDCFDIAFANKAEVAKLPPEQAKWFSGIEQIHNQFRSILLSYHLEIIDPLGQPYDPRLAEAVGMMETNKPEDDHVVLSVFQKGYKMHDRVIRPAKVRVGQYVEK